MGKKLKCGFNTSSEVYFKIHYKINLKIYQIAVFYISKLSEHWKSTRNHVAVLQHTLKIF